MKNEQVLYGLKKGDPEWKEQIISTNPKAFKNAIVWAKKAGFVKLKVRTINLEIPPDFARAVKKVK